MFHSLIEKLPERFQTKAHFAAAALDSLGAAASVGVTTLGYSLLPPEPGSARSGGYVLLAFLAATTIKWGEAAWDHIQAGRQARVTTPPANLSGPSRVREI